MPLRGPLEPSSAQHETPHCRLLYFARPNGRSGPAIAQQELTERRLVQNPSHTHWKPISGIIRFQRTVRRHSAVFLNSTL